MNDAGSAPLTELKLGAALRRYERVKLGIMVAVLIIVSTSTAYLIGLTQTTKEIGVDNRSSLVLLSCAFSPEVQAAAGPDPKNPDTAAQRKVFDACVKRGKPA